jgi:hypothetical protein
MRARFTQEGNIRKVGVLLSTFPTAGHVAQTFAQHRYDVLPTRPSRPWLHWNRFLQRSMALLALLGRADFRPLCPLPEAKPPRSQFSVGPSLTQC